MALRVGMWFARIPNRRVNIWRDPDAAARVRAAAGGNETVPTVVVVTSPSSTRRFATSSGPWLTTPLTAG